MSERERDLKLYIHWRPAPTRKNGKKKSRGRRNGDNTKKMKEIRE